MIVYDRFLILPRVRRNATRRAPKRINGKAALQSLCENILQKERFYVHFLDFSKAFDTMPYSLLWYKLIKSGVHGKLLTVLNCMYANLKSSVRTHSGVTLSSLNLPLSSSSTTSRELLPQFLTCSG